MRHFAKEILPPIVVGFLRHISRANVYVGDYRSFSEISHAGGSGAVATFLSEKTDGALSTEIDGRHLQVLAALGVAGRGKPQVSVLDVGGGNGGYYRAIAPRFTDVQLAWTVLETPEMVAAVKERTPGVLFTSDRASLRRTFDAVVISGSLQYMRAPEAELLYFSSLAQYTILTRVPISERRDHRLTAQRVGAVTIPAWIMSRERLVATLNAIGDIVMSWDVPQDRALAGLRTLPFCGFLVCRARSLTL